MLYVYLFETVRGELSCSSSAGGVSRRLGAPRGVRRRRGPRPCGRRPRRESPRARAGATTTCPAAPRARCPPAARPAPARGPAMTARAPQAARRLRAYPRKARARLQLRHGAGELRAHGDAPRAQAGRQLAPGARRIGGPPPPRPHNPPRQGRPPRDRQARAPPRGRPAAAPAPRPWPRAAARRGERACRAARRARPRAARRAPPGRPRPRRLSKPAAASPSMSARSARLAHGSPASVTGGTAAPASARSRGSSAMTLAELDEPHGAQLLGQGRHERQPARARPRSSPPGAARAARRAMAAPCARGRRAGRRCPAWRRGGAPGRAQARSSTRAASTSRARSSAGRRPSPQTSQRSVAQARGVLTVTPSARPCSASARCTSSAWEKLGTSTTARPHDASASRTRARSSGDASPSRVAVSILSAMRSSRTLVLLGKHPTAATGHKFPWGKRPSAHLSPSVRATQPPRPQIAFQPRRFPSWHVPAPHDRRKTRTLGEGAREAEKNRVAYARPSSRSSTMR